MTCYSGFGNISDGRPIWIGDFNGNGRNEILFYFPGDDNWWLGAHDGTELKWSFVGNTTGFGHGINDGRPFWIGNFSHSDRDEVLFYFPGDDNWWLGTYNGTELKWTFAGNTAGFGHGINDGRPFWIGDFNGDGRDEVLFYFPGDDNWWLGAHDGTELKWSFVGNTVGFGHGINDGRPFWIGNFSHSDRDEVLFYFPGDDNWWLGTYDGTELKWTFAGNTAGFGHGINDGRPFWIGDFNGDGRDEVLFYFPGDDNWWLGAHDGTELKWSFVGNTVGFGHGINDGRPFWIGNFSHSDRDEVLFYFPGDDNWWLGTHDGTELKWTFAGNTAGFGHGINDGRPFWTNNFSANQAEVLFYFPGDGNWWLGSYSSNELKWAFVDNTGRPCRESVVVHFKSLLPINNNINNFIQTQFEHMHELFAEGGLAVLYGTIEDLSNDPNLQQLQNLNVGNCFMGQPTQDQITLFANRNNVNRNELVVYIVSTLMGGAGNYVGCAAHPNGQPGVAIVQVNARWLLAHEVGHVLGLRHVDQNILSNRDFLMWPDIGWTNVPPDLAPDEYKTMINSTLSNPC